MEDIRANDPFKNLHSFAESELMLDELQKMSRETLKINSLTKIFNGQSELVASNLVQLAIESAIDMYTSSANRGPEIKDAMRQYIEAFHNGVVEAQNNTTLEELSKHASSPNTSAPIQVAKMAGFALVHMAQNRPDVGNIMLNNPKSIDALSELCRGINRNERSETILDKLPRTV